MPVMRVLKTNVKRTQSKKGEHLSEVMPSQAQRSPSFISQVLSPSAGRRVFWAAKNRKLEVSSQALTASKNEWRVAQHPRGDAANDRVYVQSSTCFQDIFERT